MKPKKLLISSVVILNITNFLDLISTNVALRMSNRIYETNWFMREVFRIDTWWGALIKIMVIGIATILIYRFAIKTKSKFIIWSFIIGFGILSLWFLIVSISNILLAL